MSPHTLSELIASIYDCALEPSRWERTLTEITQAISSESAILSLNDLRHDRILIEKSVGWGEFGMDERQKHTSEIHARLNEWFAIAPSLDEPFVASRQLKSHYLEESRYVQCCLKPLGIVDVMHQFLVHTPYHFSELVIGRHERHGLITDHEVGEMALLLPHLRRAIAISDALDVRAIERERMADALDAVRCGIVLTNGDGTILHVNRSADHMLRKSAGIQEAGGILSAKVPAAAQELRKAIRLAARDEAMLGKTGLAIRLTASGEPPLFAHVLPMKGSELRTRLQPEAAAAIFIGSSMAAAFKLTPAETKECLGRRFRLTKAEADVAFEILKGDGREAAAARLGIAPTTVRAHLSHIYEKTGVRRQAELVRLLMEAGAG
ncbi:helix-turn-helix transcriptional regulator [Neorhizobium petrolearium]|uniref:helix-turn-helix transcriptional regulator n=1 Tax=Neorhizobium petrolearium TaxID=515361 RepID=UPI003F817EB7